MAVKFTIPGATFTDTTLPILYPDALMTSGTLLLLDFGRSETYALGSTPTHGAQLGNIAWETAAAVIGSGSLSTLSPTFQNTFAGLPTQGLAERTTKNGLHAITSQVNMDVSSRYCGITLPSALRDYLYGALPGRSIYTSVWGRHTRLATQTVDALGHFATSATPLSNYVNILGKGALWSPAGLGRRSVPASEALGNFYASSAQAAWTGTKPGSASLSEAIFWFGSFGAYTGFQRNKAASGIWYRIYIEDLTTSGRSYATVDAADKALYDVAFGAGGRFASDSFTAVATLP